MTPAEFKEARARLGLTEPKLAALCQVSARAVQHYEGGTRPVPGPIKTLLTIFENWRSEAIGPL